MRLIYFSKVWSGKVASLFCFDFEVLDDNSLVDKVLSDGLWVLSGVKPDLDSATASAGAFQVVDVDFRRNHVLDCCDSLQV